MYSPSYAECFRREETYENRHNLACTLDDVIMNMNRESVSFACLHMIALGIPEKQYGLAMMLSGFVKFYFAFQFTVTEIHHNAT